MKSETHSLDMHHIRFTKTALCEESLSLVKLARVEDPADKNLHETPFRARH